MIDTDSLYDDAFQFLADLRGAGVYRVSEMARALETTFFMDELETYAVIQEWIVNYYERPKDVNYRN